MSINKYTGFFAGLTMMMAGSVNAAFIETTAGCGTVGSSATCEADVEDDYGYSFRISDTNTDTGHGGHSAASNYYHATLTNLAPSGSDVLIDELYFNMDATLGTDFTVANIDPSTWTISASGGGVAFNYVGDTTQAGRITAQQALVFDFVFNQTFLDGLIDPFALWTGTDASLGTGAGGGTDSGQVAVSFQTLNDINDGAGEGSDLLASNWPNGGVPPSELPEPGVLLLMGVGVLLMAGLGQRRRGR